jgi:Fe2+ transport system protein FeoA
MSPLSTRAPGSLVTIVTIASQNAPRLQRLASFGVVPGAALRLIALRPTVVVECEHTSLALEEEVAAQILVR